MVPYGRSAAPRGPPSPPARAGYSPLRSRSPAGPGWPAPRDPCAGQRRGTWQRTGRCSRGCSWPRYCSRCRIRRTTGTCFAAAHAGCRSPGPRSAARGPGWPRARARSRSRAVAAARPARVGRGVPHRVRLARPLSTRPVQRIGRGAEHPFDLVIVRVEIGAGHRPGLVTPRAATARPGRTSARPCAAARSHR